uniref:RNase H type-1 domain-containing protein n=1 Tax=Brassica oleracea TaxID=3712 RepID=A0A3P6F9U3_BRAOL|nr:unnamed protein product [Brassica oleracea]
MEVKTSNSPSFGWKSIMAAKDLLSEGLRRRIGSGYNTRVWSENWIPTIPPRQPKDNGSHRDHDLFVNQLIDQSSKTWKLDNLLSLFDPGDIPLIRSLRPSHNFSDDGFCWIYTKSGAYTVKSGYKLAGQIKERKRGALQTWALSSIPSAPGLFPSNSLYENFDYLLCRAKRNGATNTMLACFPWIAWFIWKARNEKVFNGKDILPPDTIAPTTETSEARGDDQSKPCLPRCQVDASWMANSDVFGGGLVMETEPEKHLYGSTGKEQVLSPLHAEFSSLLCAMMYSLHLGFMSMNFESDCLQMVNLINDEEEWPSLVSEWNEFVHLRYYFTGFSLSYISRKSNVRADLLAKGFVLRTETFPM